MWALDSFFKHYENKRNTEKVESIMWKAFEIEGNYARITGLIKIFEEKDYILKELARFYFLIYNKDRHKIKITKYNQSDKEVSYQIIIKVERHDFLIVNLNIQKEEWQIKCLIEIEKYNSLNIRGILDYFPHTEYPIKVVITEEEYEKVRKEIRESENKVLSAFWLN